MLRMARLNGILLITALAALTSTGWSAQRPTDDQITFWIVESMREDPRVRSSDIQVETVDGIVSLSGFVVSLADSDFARLIAMKVQGVRRVDNQLQVYAVNRSDSEISRDVRRRILQSSSVRTSGLNAEVAAGVATLTGKVESLGQLHETNQLASEVHGVRRILNRMNVVGSARRSDAEISRDIVGAMRRDVYLNTLPIEVSVNGGVVVLSGTVGNAYQRERATQEVRRTAGVVKVDNQLRVEWWQERAVRGEMPLPSDDHLQQSVLAELNQDTRLDASNIRVISKGGHVTLRGSVANYYESQLAEQNVLGVSGALWVSNLLGIRDQWREDAMVAADVTFGLQSDYLLRNQPIKVLVSDGVVSLSGPVNSSNEKVHATEVASRVRGVRSVDNKIQVRWSHKFRDAALVTRIKTRLLANWETRWVAGKIKVSVENGKATLTGDVGTWAQWREAGRVAYLTDGIWSVSLSSITLITNGKRGCLTRRPSITTQCQNIDRTFMSDAFDSGRGIVKSNFLLLK